MRKEATRGPVVGNEFVVRRVKTAKAIAPAEPIQLPAPSVLSPVSAGSALLTSTPLTFSAPRLPKLNLFAKAYEGFHAHTIASFAAIILLIGLVSSQVIGDFLAAHAVVLPALSSSKSIAGLNLSLPTAQLAGRLQQIEHQPLTVSVDTHSLTVPAATIGSWIKTSSSKDGKTVSLHVDSSLIAASLQQLGGATIHAAVNQVTVTHPDGTSHVIVPGSAGQSLSSVSSAAGQLAKNLLSGNGGSINLPVKNQAAGAVTPTAFPKLLEVDLTTKRMYAWQNGQLIRTFLVSAGKPTTPTPVGEFKIWQKLPIQTMTGFNPDGSKYIQPNVQWINYFDKSGDAVHGNYWRPLSVFGNVNTSHGCVSTVGTDAQWIYNWAPVGTTVITYN